MHSYLRTQGEKKGRSFRVGVLAYAAVGWRGVDTDEMRPAYLLFAGAEAEVRAVKANLQSGNGGHLGSPFLTGEVKLSILRSSGFDYVESCVYAADGTVEEGVLSVSMIDPEFF